MIPVNVVIPSMNILNNVIHRRWIYYPRNEDWSCGRHRCMPFNDRPVSCKHVPPSWRNKHDNVKWKQQLLLLPTLWWWWGMYQRKKKKKQNRTTSSHCRRPWPMTKSYVKSRKCHLNRHASLHNCWDKQMPPLLVPFCKHVESISHEATLTTHTSYEYIYAHPPTFSQFIM